MGKKAYGFTIVELLIVIVVIAILATITIVAYNGVQQRALNTSRISSAKAALTLVNGYYAVNQSYPTVPATPLSTIVNAACIGENWPELDGSKVCWNLYTDGSGPGASTFSQSDDVNSALKTIGSLPDFPKQKVGTGISNGRPVELAALALVERPTSASSTFPRGYSLAYMLQGDSISCGVAGAVASSLATYHVTRCVVPLEGSSW